jgi:outer membrane protein OmpA-like peptidoglycan-associated protein
MMALVDQEDEEMIKKIEKGLEICENGIELMKNPVEIIETKLSKGINSEYIEHSPVLSADESVIIFTSKRKGTGDKISGDGTYFEDIYISKNKDGIWTEPHGIGPNINTEWNEATIGLSVDGQQLFIYKDDQFGSIYTSRLEGETWTVPRKLGSEINTRARETHASLSANGKILYFTSDRKGGYGGMDIYRSILQDNGEWGAAENLGPTVNTPEDEATPFIHADETTLYFSSKGQKTMGGFDIFSVKLQSDGSWSVPENIGYPVNTTGDDLAFVVTPDFKRAYYSSYKGGSTNSDIYMITFIKAVENPIAVVTGTVKSMENRPPKDVEITVIDTKTKDVVTVTKANSATGNYLFILSAGKDYLIFFEADDHLFYSERIVLSHRSKFQSLQKPVVLNPITIGETFQQYQLEFQEGDTGITNAMDLELSELSEYLSKNEELVVEIPIQPDDEISKLRSEAIKKYLKEKHISNESIVEVIDSAGMLSSEVLMVLNVLDRQYMSLKEKKYKIRFDKEDLSLDESSERNLENLSGVITTSKNLQINVSVIEGDKVSKIYSNTIIDKLEQLGVPREKIIINTLPRESGFNNIVMVNVIREVDEEKVKQFMLAFEDNEYSVNDMLEDDLNDISNALTNNPDLIVEIGEDPMNDISKDRTKAIIQSLKEKNIPTDRIKVKTISPEDIEEVGGQTQLTLRDKQGAAIDQQTEEYAQEQAGTAKTSEDVGYLELEVERADKSNLTGKIQDELSISSIFFDFNKASTNQYNDVLKDIADYLNNYKNYEVVIEAYADAYGASDYNEELSRRRGDFVRNFLTQEGIDYSKISIKPHGENFPIANNQYNEGRRYNRRVDIKIMSPKGNIYSSDNIDIPSYLDMRYTIVVKESDVKLPSDYFYDYQDLSAVKVEFFDNKYIYKIGSFKYREDAEKFLSENIRQHFSNAYIVRNYEISRKKITGKSLRIPGSGEYAVQILALSRKISLDYFQNVNNIKVYFDRNDDLYKYVVGNFSDTSGAKAELSRLISLGYPDAFITRMSKYDNSELVE